MKAHFIIFFLGLISLNGISQHFVSDSVCYKSLITYEILKCDTSDHWEIDRNGDFILTKHWLNEDLALMHSIRIQNRTNEETGYLKSGARTSTQFFTCRANDNIKVFFLDVLWETIDSDDNGKWDQLRFYWIENRATLARIIYCHLE